MNSPHRYEVTVQLEDVDSLRIVHHTRLIAYLERARVDLFAACGIPVAGAEFSIVLHNLAATFVAPARLLDRLTVSTTVELIDELRLVLVSKIRREKVLVMKAISELAFTDAHTGTIVPAPAVIGQRLGALKEKPAKRSASTA